MLLMLPSEKRQSVAKVRGDQIYFVPAISKVGGDASHGSHRVVAPMTTIRIIGPHRNCAADGRNVSDFVTAVVCSFSARKQTRSTLISVVVFRCGVTPCTICNIRRLSYEPDSEDKV